MDKHLPTDYQQYIALSRYARWREDLNRRETWEETVDRYFNYIRKRLGSDAVAALENELAEARKAVLNLEVMPSMRALMTAGKAAEASGDVCLYNCSFVPVDHPHAFDEIMFVLLCGTGVGFTVESVDVNKLPDIPAEFYKSDSTIVVPDSKIGWATSLRELLSMLYAGKIPLIDYSKIRPAGAKLKTFGGRASGPQPLKDLFEFCIAVFKGAAGRKLRTVECHDIVCKIADTVVVGGVRRSALISLSDLNDSDMRHCKSGNWWEKNGQRALANNSAVYNQKPDPGQFMEEFSSLYRSGSGERGIFNRSAVKKACAREDSRREFDQFFGTNPCAEIILRPYQFCNLTSVQIAPYDQFDDLIRKVRIATLLGTIQASFTNFKYLRKIWKKNCEEERLLGVSLSGICDNYDMSGGYVGNIELILRNLKECAIHENVRVAGILGINQATAITCVKPEGTTSQLCDRASGIHPRYSPFYIRTVRADKKDPLCKMMVDMGFPCEDDVTKPNDIKVFSFPIKSPDSSLMRDDMSAIDQLKLWLVYKKYWAEHTVSITVYVREHEWVSVAAFVYENFDDISGISFLPHTDHIYKQAPYQEITEQEYNEWVARMPKDVDWLRIADYEKDDETTGMQELACIGGQCELK